MAQGKDKKSWWKKFVDKLASANEKQYGDDVPDCCGDGKKKKMGSNFNLLENILDKNLYNFNGGA
jgi:hypothetical protein